jgi:hypothetical protein
MASIRNIAATGFGRAEEEQFRSLFEAANRRVGGSFRLVAPDQAEALIIDADSIYGQMGLMQAQGSGKVLVAITSGSRADADHRLSHPLTEAALAELLGTLGAGAGTALPPRARAVEPPAARAEATRTAASSPAPMAPAPSAIATPPAARPPAPTPNSEAPAPVAPRQRSLFEHLQPGALAGPTRIERKGAPPLVIDAQAGVYLGAAALKPYIEYLKSPIADGELRPLNAAALPALEAQLGGRQPIQRLLWLAALHAGEGQLIGFEPGTRFKLGKWPQIEREFPKHFRIATVMMKGPATVDEIAAAAGASREEVCDLLNAYLATGFAEAEQAAPSAAQETARSGLLDRLRGKRG